MAPSDDALYTERPHPPQICPRCGKFFEAPFTVNGVLIPGHVPGGPLCHPVDRIKTRRESEEQARRRFRERAARSPFSKR